MEVLFLLPLLLTVTTVSMPVAQELQGDVVFVVCSATGAGSLCMSERGEDG